MPPASPFPQAVFSQAVFSQDAFPQDAVPQAAGLPAKAERIAALRRLVAEPGFPPRSGAAMPLGLPAVDRLLPGGGLARGALHEVRPAGEADEGAALGFLAALLARSGDRRDILFVAMADAPAPGLRLSGHGLAALGLDPGRLVLAQARTMAEALWAMEEGLRSRAPAAVAGLCLGGLDLGASRRLHLAATQAEIPLLLMRPAKGPAASAAVTRWRIAAAPARRDRFGLLDRWRWRVGLERCRNGRTGEWVLEWDHAAHRFDLSCRMADSAFPAVAA